MTLTEFLLARIDEDEVKAKRDGADAMLGFRWKHYPRDAYAAIQSLTLANSARLLAECEAKRRIVEALADDTNTPSPDFDGGYDYGLELAARALATVYADHPDYRDEWKP